MDQAGQTFDMATQSAKGAGDALLAFFQGAKGQAVTVSTEGLQTLTARQLQVLLSAKAQWDSDGVPFDISPVSEGFEQGLRGLGLSPSHFTNEVQA